MLATRWLTYLTGAGLSPAGIIDLGSAARPYDPADELPNRFFGLISDDLINNVVEQMHELVGDQWAPRNNEKPDDYDESFDFYHIAQKSQPLVNLKERIAQYRQLFDLQQDDRARSLCKNLVYSAAVGALETFLWETIHFWIDNDDRALHTFITRIQVFRDEPIKLGDIFERQKNLKEHVKAYLQNLVWHRLDKVIPLFEHGLSIDFPSAKFFKDALKKRHDIIHRSGQNLDQIAIVIEDGELYKLFDDTVKLASKIDALLSDRKITNL